MVKMKTPTLALTTYEVNVNGRRYRYAVLTKKGRGFANALSVKFL